MRFKKQRITLAADANELARIYIEPDGSIATQVFCEDADKADRLSLALAEAVILVANGPEQVRAFRRRTRRKRADRIVIGF